MEHRHVVGSWLEGPRAAAAAAGAEFGYRGERFGLPRAGRGSLAGFGARLFALVLDWVACMLVVRLLLPVLPYASDPYALATLAVFASEVCLLTWLGGGSFGQRLRRIQVLRLDGRPVGLPRAVIRTLLLSLAVPALIWDRDGRGLHDKAAGTAVVRL